MNGDGIDDIIIGALTVTESYSGAAYVVFGRGGSRYSVDLKTMSAAEGFVLTGHSWWWLGYSVSGAG